MEFSTWNGPGMYQILAFPDSSQKNEWNISNVGNSRLTKRTSTKCGKVPSLTTCTTMMHGKFGEYRLKEHYVCARVWQNLHRGRSHRLPHGCTMSESQCPSLNCMILYGSYFREFWRWLICHQQPATSHLPLCSSTTGTSSAQNTQQVHVDSTRHPKRTEMFKRHREHVECVKTPQPTVLTDFRVDPHASTFTELSTISLLASLFLLQSLSATPLCGTVWHPTWE